ncbi:lipid-transfer protein [Umezawaea endophytica]|uniref:propanoyl-CoA C-acyltransferase n=1 Tax=Umezawaea endophytica TaxID=1654476 RepID=A0A9X3AD68_9PSEU|nr:lipid-transfer protein [Umezawaea endophytica]MCS7475817.1 lipid-transfer protein [Umezawaea endophytica]
MGAAVIAGVGMVPFTKPSAGARYEDMAAGAVRAALSDAGLDYTDVEQAYAGWVYGDSTSGQAALYGVGLTGVPVFNVNNNCSTGSTALFLARQAVESGAVQCALALGFEQMTPGALSTAWSDRTSPFAAFDAVNDRVQGAGEGPMAARYFGGAGRVHVERFGTRPETFAKISVKARAHAAHNPYAVFRDPVTVEQVMASPMIHDPLTRLMCCPPTCGAASAVVCTPEFAARHGVDASVVVRAQAMTTDTPGTFESDDLRKLVGADMTRAAARQVYEASGVGPQDIRVVELHDCFATNELISYEALDLTPEGTGEKFVEDGDNTYGGRVVTNPSGGLLSKGHPLGATGLAQCAELVWQLRGTAGARQVDGVKLALQHNIGLGGAAVVTLYEKVG